VIISFDIGSSSVRAIACLPKLQHGPQASSSDDPVLLDGTLATAPCSLRSDGTADAHTFRGHIERVFDECLEATRRHAGGRTVVVDALSFAAFAMSLVGVDSSSGEPLTPVYTYARSDPTAAAAAAALREALAADPTAGPGRLRRLYAELGSPVHTAYAPALFFQLAGGPLSLAAVTWQTLGSWVLARWRGKPHGPISTSEASWAGLLDVAACAWHREMCGFLGLRLPGTSPANPLAPGALHARVAGRLPHVVDFAACAASCGAAGEVAGALGPAAAARWPEAAAALLFLPVGDGACASVGSRCGAGLGRVAVTIGTSAAARIILDAPTTAPLAVAAGGGGSGGGLAGVPALLPAGLWCYRVDTSRVVVGGALTDGGLVVDWLRTLLGLRGDADFDEAVAEAARAEPNEELRKLRGDAVDAGASGEKAGGEGGEGGGAHGLSILPFLGAERSPGWHDGASGSLHGLRRGTTRGQVVARVLWCWGGVGVGDPVSRRRLLYSLQQAQSKACSHRK